MMRGNLSMLKKLLPIFIISTGINAFSYDAGQTVLDQDLDNSEIEAISEKDDAHLPSSTDDILENESTNPPDNSGSHITIDEKDSLIEKMDKKKSFKYQQSLLDELKNDEYIEIDKKKLRETYLGTGDKTFSLAYHRELSSFEGESYERMYDGDDSIDGGTLFLHFDRILSKGALELGYSIGGGVGFKSGKGYFETTPAEKSDTSFKLWSFPIDGHLLVGIPMGQYAKLSFSAGPSGLGLAESRDDFESNEEGKEKTQFGYGYSARFLAQVSLSSMMENFSHSMFDTYSVTNVFLNFEGRYSQISNFQDDDLEYNGSFLGIGLTFEYK